VPSPVYRIGVVAPTKYAPKCQILALNRLWVGVVACMLKFPCCFTHPCHCHADSKCPSLCYACESGGLLDWQLRCSHHVLCKCYNVNTFWAVS